MKMTTFTLEHIANMIFLTSGEQVWRAWDESEFTERKLNNAWKRIEKNFLGNVELVKKF